MSRKIKEIVKVDDDKVIVFKGTSGQVGSVIQVESEKCRNQRIFNYGFREYSDIALTVSKETYMERLCLELEEELEQIDKIIVAEAFKKNRIIISYPKYKVMDSIRISLGKKPKNSPVFKKVYLGREERL